MSKKKSINKAKPKKRTKSPILFKMFLSLLFLLLILVGTGVGTIFLQKSQENRSNAVNELYTCPLNITAITGVQQWDDGFPMNAYGRDSHGENAQAWQAIDINGYEGSIIYSASAGVVIDISGPGNTEYNLPTMRDMTVKGDDGYFYQYHHVVEPTVQKNNRVTKGQPIARLASLQEIAQANRTCALNRDQTTEQCIKIHLHFSVYQGNFENPSGNAKTIQFIDQHCNLRRNNQNQAEFPQLPTINCAKITGNPNISNCFTDQDGLPIACEWNEVLPECQSLNSAVCNEFCVDDESCQDGLVCHQVANTGYYQAIGSYNIPNSNEVREIAVRGDYIFARTVDPVSNNYPPFTLMPGSNNWYDLHQDIPLINISAIAAYNIGTTGVVRQIATVVENDRYEIYYRDVNPATNHYPPFVNKIPQTSNWFTTTGSGPIYAMAAYNITPFSNEVKQIIIRGSVEPRLYQRIVNTATNSYPDFEYLEDRQNNWYTGTGTGSFVDIATHNIAGSNKVREIVLRGTSSSPPYVPNVYTKDATPVQNIWPKFVNVTNGSQWLSQTINRACRAAACKSDSDCNCQTGN